MQGPQAVKDNQGKTCDQHLLTSEKSVVRLDAKLVDELHENSKVSSSCSSTDLSSHTLCLENCHVALSNFLDTSLPLR